MAYIVCSEASSEAHSGLLWLNFSEKTQHNYRPISLLSVFYKLNSCVITQRLKHAVESFVGKQQKAYRNNIGSCIVNLKNMMNYVKGKEASPHLAN